MATADRRRNAPPRISAEAAERLAKKLPTRDALERLAQHFPNWSSEKVARMRAVLTSLATQEQLKGIAAQLRGLSESDEHTTPEEPTRRYRRPQRDEVAEVLKTISHWRRLKRRELLDEVGDALTRAGKPCPSDTTILRIAKRKPYSTKRKQPPARQKEQQRRGRLVDGRED